VVVTLMPGNDGVAIQVDDHGGGMAPDEAQRLTEAFARGDGARSVPGPGLGLAIVVQVVNRLGGQLSFERLDSGQRVRVTLPLPPLRSHAPGMGPAAGAYFEPPASNAALS
jgi:signal transduction histidine kinase